MKTVLEGIDVSHHNGKFAISNILKMDSNVQFVIIKATEGVGWQDDMMTHHADVAKMNKLEIGFYHYARPELNPEPKAEAASFVTAIRPYIGKAVLALDWEGEGANRFKDSSWARDWCDEVYRLTGVRPMVYCSASRVNHIAMRMCADGNYGLWCARWGLQPIDFGNWKFMAVWQYSSKPYDKDRFFGRIEQWKKYAAVDGEFIEPDKKCGCTCGLCCCHEDDYEDEE